MNLSSFGLSYRDPSRSCFTLDSGVTPYGQRANPYRYFRRSNYKDDRRRFHEFIAVLFEEHFFFCLDTKETKNQA
jgi:hypothetical protein